MIRTMAKKWRSLLKRNVIELVMSAEELCPDSEVTIRSPFEADGEDVVIEVRVPPEKYDLVDEALLKREIQILEKKPNSFKFTNGLKARR